VKQNASKFLEFMPKMYTMA